MAGSEAGRQLEIIEEWIAQQLPDQRTWQQRDLGTVDWVVFLLGKYSNLTRYWKDNCQKRSKEKLDLVRELSRLRARTVDYEQQMENMKEQYDDPPVSAPAVSSGDRGQWTFDEKMDEMEHHADAMDEKLDAFERENPRLEHPRLDRIDSRIAELEQMNKRQADELNLIRHSKKRDLVAKIREQEKWTDDVRKTRDEYYKQMLEAVNKLDAIQEIMGDWGLDRETDDDE